MIVLSDSFVLLGFCCVAWGFFLRLDETCNLPNPTNISHMLLTVLMMTAGFLSPFFKKLTLGFTTTYSEETLTAVNQNHKLHS